MKEKKYNILKWIAWTILGGLALFATIMVFGSNGTSWPEQVMAACLGALITILATRLLLSSQSEIDAKAREAEDKAKKNQDFYNAKLGVYSKYISKMYDAYKDNEISPEELRELRALLFGEVSFYAKEQTLEKIDETMKNMGNFLEKVPRFFAEITAILQNDLREDLNGTSPQKNEDLWKKFQKIIDSLEQEENENEDREPDVTNNSQTQSNTIDVNTNQEQQTEGPKEQPKRLKQQAWHFIMWGDKQLEKMLKEGFTELSLVEYGEYWRTNLVKQVRRGDIIMLFRRGGYGYIGAYKAIGRRVFVCEDNVVTEEYLKYGEDPIVKKEECWNGERKIYEDKETVKHLKEFDIYDSILGDGATSCANIIVEPIAFKEGGVGNPGGVYRRTISRYDSLYAGMLMQRFEKAGVIIDGKENDYELYVS